MSATYAGVCHHRGCILFAQLVCAHASCRCSSYSDFPNRFGCNGLTNQFKHALIRDTAYEALLKSRRKELHGVVARTIDENFSALKQAHPEVLARHWTEAGAAAP